MRNAVLLLAVLLAVPASAQFSIDWSAVDGGGGTSTGGVAQQLGVGRVEHLTY